MAPVDSDAQDLGDTLKHFFSWENIHSAVRLLVKRIPANRFDSVFGIPGSGAVVAAFVSGILDLPIIDRPFLIRDEKKRHKCLIVDDLVDSGETMRIYKETGFYCDALYRKARSPQNLCPNAVQMGHEWLVFPWEHEDGPESNVRRILQYVGEDPDRGGLKETPNRFIRAFEELTKGYRADLKAILGKKFESESDQMVVVRDIPFWSLCEHHMLPFSGTVTVGYLPSNGVVVGLSKIPRLVEALSRRLQIQEGFTQQISEEMAAHVSPDCGTIVKANHLCMQMRGVKLPAEMVTSCLKGAFLNSAREEFLRFMT